MELYLLARTINKSDARSITLIMPNYPYARQDKKDNFGEVFLLKTLQN